MIDGTERRRRAGDPRTGRTLGVLGRWWAAAAVLLAPSLSACGDEPAEPLQEAPRWIEVMPDSVRLTYIGERVDFQVRLHRDSRLYGGTDVKWSSTDTTVLTVGVNGEVTARDNGEARLAAEFRGFHDTAYVRVRQEAAELEILGGDNQRGAPGHPLADSVGVRLIDAGGTVLSISTHVHFDASGHGGRTRHLAGPRGEEWVVWTLGPVPGPQTLAVWAHVGPGRTEFGAVALDPDSLVAVLAVLSGANQGALPGEVLADPVVVAVLDSLGRRIPGAAVRFEAARGHGTVEPADVRSDTLGLAATTWTLGEEPGTQSLVASALAGGSVEITARTLSDEGVCARTPVVADEIVSVVGAAGCAEVTEAQLAGIESLYFYDNTIRRLKGGDFAGLVNLKDLHLALRSLTALPPDIFTGLGSLKGLWIRGTQLTELPPAVFAGLSELTAVLVVFNYGVTELPPDVFSGLSSLQSIALYENRLEALRPDVFAGLGRLGSIRLHRNRLSELPAGVFTGLDSLNLITLHGNRLRTLRADPFAGLSRLTSVPSQR